MSSRGELIRAGAPLVKNVTGFDLCRLLVGSLGTLAVLAEVVLRCRPRPETEQWWVGEPEDPFALEASLHQPLSVLWDGAGHMGGAVRGTRRRRRPAPDRARPRLPAGRGSTSPARAGASVVGPERPPQTAGRRRFDG